MQTSSLREKMFGLVEAWQTCGMSQKSFCQLHALQYGTFQYWCRKYRNTPNEQAGFTELIASPADPLPAAGFAECYFPNGTRLVLCQPVSTDYLRTLIG